MDASRRELLVARICSGTVRIRVGDHTFLLRHPAREKLYLAAEEYVEALAESHLEGLYSDEELVNFLFENELWDEERDKKFKSLPKEIEELKVKLYKSTFKSKEKELTRKALAVAKGKLLELAHQRSSYNHLSCAGVASIAKTRRLIGYSLFTTAGQPVFGDSEFWLTDCRLIDDVLSALSCSRIEESEMRDLARNEPWRSLWNCRKEGASLFGCSTIDFSDEQRSLINWSLLYDNIYQHPECPSDDVVGDDDSLDGWMIDQRQQREKKSNVKDGEQLISNEKIRNSQEVFLVAETIEDARKVVDLNSDAAKAIQQQRFNLLKKKGQVEEKDMPDTRQRIGMDMVNMRKQ